MLHDWTLQVRMLDYGQDTKKENAILNELVCALASHFYIFDADFTNNGSGGIISNIFEGKIQSNLEGYWDDFFDSEHSYEVTAINTELDTPLVWHISNGNIEFEYNCCFIDAWGNCCNLDTTNVFINRTYQSEEDIYAIPVKKILETGNGDGEGVIKFPEVFKSCYENNDYEIDEFSELLRAKVPGLLYGKYGDCLYLLDKNGNRITDIKDFDHSEPDADGYIYYPVPESDLIDGDPCEMLTPEACEKWRAKLGL